MATDKAATLSLDDVRQKIEEYETTLMAIQALSRILIDYFNSIDQSIKIYTSIGRGMTTSESNRIHKLNSVTPDFVIQVGDTWGTVVETKRSLPKNNDDRWRPIVTQLEKYDDTLKGWWTNSGDLSSHNLAILIDVDRSIDFSRYIESLKTEGNLVDFSRPTAIIEFFKKQEVKQFLRIRMVWGDIHPSDLRKFLESGKSVPVEGLVDSLKFYDHEPEVVEYTMVLLWQNVFSERRLESKYDEKLKAWLINVDLDELTDYLQKIYGQKSNEARQCTFPRRKWIKKALDAFVSIDLAQQSHDQNKYVINFKRMNRVDIFEKFYTNRLKKNKRQHSSLVIQPELFTLQSDDERDQQVEEISV